MKNFESNEEASKYFEKLAKSDTVYYAFKPSTSKVMAEPAEEGKCYESVNEKGEETSRTAGKGDMLITSVDESGKPVILPNGKCNQWVQTQKEFKDCYITTKGNDGLYQPKGDMRRFVKLKQDIDFPAPWGEAFHGRKGDMICISDANGAYGVSTEFFNKSYVIDHKEFPAKER